MGQAAIKTHSDRNLWGGWYALSVSVVPVVAGLAINSWDGLVFMVHKWSSEVYGHGYFIPVITVLLIAQKRRELSALELRGAWAGTVVALAGLTFAALGELATLFVIIQYGFLATLFGIVLSFVGWRGIRHIWLPLVYLAFMIPLPQFLYGNLSAEMQLVSSSFGVWFIRLAGIPVFLSGNIIDLGEYKLQVVEACSGLRYLFPLMSFAFLIAYLYKGPFWHKALLFLSTVPITIVMNSLRIAMIGIAFETGGVDTAEGALHFIQGWTIFMACVAILFAETWLLMRISGDGTPLYRAFRLDLPKPVADPAMTLRHGLPRPFLGCVGLVLLALATSILMAQRATASLPARDSLVAFPMRVGDWKGRQFGLEKKILDVLDVDDYIIANYMRPGDPVHVNFYVAYYASQKAGSAAHSPRSCIPGGGWRITELSERAIDNSGGSPLVVNRVVIKKGNLTQLVYYWFEGQGRVLTNEYLIKWFLLWDGVTRNRTDGSLVRLVTRVTEEATFEQADRRLAEFVRAVYPQFPAYMPR